MTLTALERLVLNANAFAGPVPIEVANLTGLISLHLASNQFTQLPDLTGLADLDNVRVENNLLTFEDIEPNIGIAETFTYAPQGKVGSVRGETTSLGESEALHIPVGGANNEYQWFKDGAAVAGAASDTYTIDSVTESDLSSYVLEITNTVVSDLTLRSHPIHLVFRIGGSTVTFQIHAPAG